MRKLASIVILLSVMQTAVAQEFDVQQLGKGKIFDWSGSLGASTSYYNTTGPNKQNNPLTYNFNGNVNIRIMNLLDLPFGFTVTKFQSSFTKPFLQFGISPTYKWAKLHLGHRSLNFNPYTLAGQTFLGAGVELNPRKFRFAAMYGRFKPAIDIDTTTNTAVVPSFKRTGYGVKIGYGDENNFIDLIYFQAKDDQHSINWNQQEIMEKINDANPLLPVKNRVLGFSGKTTIKQKFQFVVDGGLSFYNPNTSDLQVNPGIDKVDLSKKLDWAGKSSISYAFPHINLKFDYERILPGYITLGSNFFNTDIQNITFSPSGDLFKGKLTYALSAGLQKNNLDDKKTETTKRFIGNGNMSINPTPYWGVDMNYNNFRIKQLPGTLPINDSTRIRQVNQTITITPRFVIVKDTTATHNFVFTGSMNDVNDRNIITKEYGNMRTMMASFNHNSTFNRRGNSINSGLNYNIVKTTQLLNTQIGATIGYSQAFFKNALSTTANINYNKSLIDKKADGSIINGSLSMVLTFLKKNSLSLNLNMISTKSQQYEDYVETIGTLTYALQLK